MADIVITDTGKKVPKLTLGPSYFVDKTAVLYGPTKTGKTVIVKNIMKLVQNRIEQVLIVAPSEPSNRSYEGFVDSTLIHYRLWLPNPKNPKKDDGVVGALRFLESIWQRQEMMASIYVRANNLDTLTQLYSRLPSHTRKDGDKYLDQLAQMRARVLNEIRRKFNQEIGRRDEKCKEVEEKFTEMLTLVYKRFISSEIKQLWNEFSLSDDERYSLNYLFFNPRLLLIFDDCAAHLKPLFNKDIFRKFFYQNRHSFISMVICCQDDTDLPTNLRKNAFVSIFTEPIVCMSNFDRMSNKFSKQTRSYINEIISAVFQGYRKLVYIREDDCNQHFYHMTATYPKPFRFGSEALIELCNLVRAEGVSMDKENPYYDKFRI
jgi:Cdc6-like AAA superfamily ATPase